MERDKFLRLPLKLCQYIEKSLTHSILDKAPLHSISIVIWILSSDTETSATTPLGGGARKVLAK